jgi:hypothetical protein
MRLNMLHWAPASIRRHACPRPLSHETLVHLHKDDRPLRRTSHAARWRLAARESAGAESPSAELSPGVEERDGSVTTRLRFWPDAITDEPPV